MRYLKAGLFGAPLLLLSFAVLSTGCGGGGGGDDEDYKPKRRSQGGTPVVVPVAQRKPIVAQDNQYSVIQGKITFDGSSPGAALDTAFLNSMTTDGQYCRSGVKPGGGTFPLKPIEQQQQEVRVGKNGNLGNVFVWIEPADARTQYFQVPEDQLKKFKDTTKLVSQPHCVFLPHCTVLFPKYYKDGGLTESGQRLEVENDAFVAHNTKFTGSENKKDVLIGAQKDGKINKELFTLEPEPRPFFAQCSVHGWMRAYFLVRDHPYAAVSSVGAKNLDAKDQDKKVYEDLNDPNFGTYRIEGVPVGAKVVLRAWHERLGDITPRAGEPLVITKEAMTKDFTAKMK